MRFLLRQRGTGVPRDKLPKAFAPVWTSIWRAHKNQRRMPGESASLFSKLPAPGSSGA